MCEPAVDLQTVTRAMYWQWRTSGEAAVLMTYCY